MIRSILCALGGIAASASASSQESKEAPADGQPYWIEQAKAAAQLQGITVGETVRRQRLQDRAELQNERFSEDPDDIGARFENGGPELRVRFYFKQGASAKTIGDRELSGIASRETSTLTRRTEPAAGRSSAGCPASGDETGRGHGIHRTAYPAFSRRAGAI